MTFLSLQDNVISEGVDTIHVSGVLHIQHIRDAGGEHIDSYVRGIEAKIHRVFPFCRFDTHYSGKSIVLNASKTCGIYISIELRRQVILITCQFGGVFFLLFSFHLCPVLCRQLSLECGTFFRLTRLDEYVDATGSVSSFFPPSDGDFYGKYYVYNFKYKRDIWGDNKNRENRLKETGFSLSNSTFEFCVYDKMEELRKSKNPAKKELFLSYLSKVKESSITRIEARLKGDSLEPIREYFYSNTLTEKSFLQSSRHLMSKRRKLKVRSTGVDKDARRYPVDRNWVFRFNMNDDCYLDSVKPNNLLVLDIKPNLERATEKFLKVLVANQINDPIGYLDSLDQKLIEDIIRKQKIKEYDIKNSRNYFKKILRDFENSDSLSQQVFEFEKFKKVTGVV